MCGISGQLRWSERPDMVLVGRMTAALAHRGPDGEGVAELGPIVLGHRRLAIIDLSEAAAQPMTDRTGQLAIVFNGEIYNYRELRAELKQLGAVFRTRSDTEVILEAYRQWGTEALGRFNGMFAFALWDSRDRSLLLARDRVGKKPLYYRVHPDGGVTFASELSALLLDPTLRRRLNRRAVSQFLSLNYTLTSDAIIEDVHKVKPAHFIVCREGGQREHCYWDLASWYAKSPACRTPQEAEEAVRGLLDDAVKTRLVSDVPLGVFLSGGVDSAAITASMCQAVAPGDVHSFSMGFQERSFSEVDEARATAAALSVQHHATETDADVAALMPQLSRRSDEPFADTSLIPTYLLSQFARSRVTVCLSGDGGDEVFAGYQTYVADKLHAHAGKMPVPVMRGAAAMVGLLPVSFNKVSLDYKLRQFVSARLMSPARAHYHWRTVFSDLEKQAVLHPEIRDSVLAHDPGEAFERFDREVAADHPVTRGLYVDMKTWLADDILVKADRASMAHGLELRAPFLDHRLIEFAATLPIEWKMPGFDTKVLLKNSQRNRLPAAVLARKKQGFNAPVAYWLQSTFKRQFEQLTLGGSALPLFDQAYVKDLWDAHSRGYRDNSHKLLGLIQLQLWCAEHQPTL